MNHGRGYVYQVGYSIISADDAPLASGSPQFRAQVLARNAIEAGLLLIEQLRVAEFEPVGRKSGNKHGIKNGLFILRSWVAPDDDDDADNSEPDQSEVATPPQSGPLQIVIHCVEQSVAVDVAYGVDLGASAKARA